MLREKDIKPENKNEQEEQNETEGEEENLALTICLPLLLPVWCSMRANWKRIVRRHTSQQRNKATENTWKASDMAMINFLISTKWFSGLSYRERKRMREIRNERVLNHPWESRKKKWENKKRIEAT